MAKKKDGQSRRNKLFNMSKIAKLAFDLDDSSKSCVTNKYESSNKIIEIKDVIYCDQDSEICKLDIFKPELVIDAKLPVLVNVHGGGWITGDKKWRVGQGKLFADMGMCVINVNYGLSPKYKYVDALRHVVKAMKWLENNAEEYSFDLDNVFVTGDSAGGQIACQLCATLHNRTFLERLGAEPVNFKIKGAMLHCGAYDFDGLKKTYLARDIIYDMTGVEYDKIDEYEFKDLLYTLPWVDENFPQKVFIVYGKNDVFVGKHHIPLIERLKELGKEVVEYYGKFPGVHCFHLYYKTKESRKMYALEKKYLMSIVRDKEEKK